MKSNILQIQLSKCKRMGWAIRQKLRKIFLLRPVHHNSLSTIRQKIVMAEQMNGNNCVLLDL